MEEKTLSHTKAKSRQLTHHQVLESPMTQQQCVQALTFFFFSGRSCFCCLTQTSIILSKTRQKSVSISNMVRSQRGIHSSCLSIIVHLSIRFPMPTFLEVPRTYHPTDFILPVNYNAGCHIV